MISNKKETLMKKFAFSYPVLFSIVVIILAGLVTSIKLNPLFDGLLGNHGAEFLSVTIMHTITGFALIWIIKQLGIWQYVKFNSLKNWKSIWLVWPFLLFAYLGIEPFILGIQYIAPENTWLIGLFVLLTLSIGFAEEVMGRGLVLNIILKKYGRSPWGIYKAVLISGFVFGVAHIFNFLFGDMSLMQNITQIIFSFFFGVAFAACYLRNQSIWPVIIIHALQDFSNGLYRFAETTQVVQEAANNDVMSAVISIALTSTLFVHGLIILRKVKNVEVIEELSIAGN